MLFTKSQGPNGATKVDKYPAETVGTNEGQNSSAVNEGIRLITESCKSCCFLGHYECEF